MSGVSEDIAYLAEVEQAAHQVLVDRADIISLSRRQNETREAWRAVEKTPESKVWLSIGSMMVRMPKEQSLHLLKKDIEVLTGDLNKLKSELKVKANKVQQLEHRRLFDASGLIPLSRAEIAGLGNLLGKK